MIWILIGVIVSALLWAFTHIERVLRRQPEEYIARDDRRKESQ